MRALVLGPDFWAGGLIADELAAAGHEVVGLAPTVAAALALVEGVAPEVALVARDLGRGGGRPPSAGAARLPGPAHSRQARRGRDGPGRGAGCVHPAERQRPHTAAGDRGGAGGAAEAGGLSWRLQDCVSWAWDAAPSPW
jgi:hypothetical protein